MTKVSDVRCWGKCASVGIKGTGRVLVSVGREDNVKFVGLCEARGIPALSIGVTYNSGELEIQDIAALAQYDRRGACNSLRFSQDNVYRCAKTLLMRVEAGT